MNRRPVVLASASPARLGLLRAAGIEPAVRVSGIDEDAVAAELGTDGDADPTLVCATLAAAKARAVAAAVRDELPEALVIGADSVLDLDGTALGKPGDAGTALRRWAAMSGRTATLRTGHAVVDVARSLERQAVCSTTVHFGHPDQVELAAYVASGEPLQVAGAFTLDGRGAAFVDGVDGDPSNVVGLSLPTLRRLLADLGVRWTDLWSRP